MKIRSLYIVLLAGWAGVISCKKDNYSAPSSTLSGHIVYKGEAIGVEYNQVPLELYQYGFGKVAKIGSFSSIPYNSNGVGNVSNTFAPDGGYSALLFDGSYKLVIQNDQGPFIWPTTAGGSPDSVAISMKGNQTMDLNVIPYYMIRTPVITAAGGNVSAKFKAEKIVTDPATARDIQSVSLFISKTEFPSSDVNNGRSDLNGAAIADPNNISLNVAIPANFGQNYLFARVAIQIAGREDRILSPLQKLSF
ncbi:MAG TPA: DUF3823 domain-containing protein [Puia sp.]|nr:DUF3823 domain-containing protein [Puia sp.]